jgi:hypothetical protein
MKVAMATGWRFHGHPHQVGTPVVAGWIRWLRTDQRILKIAFYFAAIAIPSYFFLGALFVERVPKDIGALASALLIVLLVLYIARRHKPFHIIERACAYVAAICVVYLVQVMPGALANFTFFRNVLFAAMTVAVALFGSRRTIPRNAHGFSRDPVLCRAASPVVNIEMGNAGMAVMLIVLFYSIELVQQHLAAVGHVVDDVCHAGSTRTWE